MIPYFFAYYFDKNKRTTKHNAQSWRYIDKREVFKLTSIYTGVWCHKVLNFTPTTNTNTTTILLLQPFLVFHDLL